MPPELPPKPLRQAVEETLDDGLAHALLYGEPNHAMADVVWMDASTTEGFGAVFSNHHGTRVELPAVEWRKIKHHEPLGLRTRLRWWWNDQLSDLATDLRQLADWLEGY